MAQTDNLQHALLDFRTQRATVILSSMYIILVRLIYMVIELGIRSGSRCLYGCSLLPFLAWMVREIAYKSSWNSASDLY